ERATETDAIAGLLEHLADGTVHLRLTGCQLPLGQAPVAVPGPMDHRHLDRWLSHSAISFAPENSAGGSNGVGVRHQAFRQRPTRRFHALGYRRRPSSNAALQRSTSRPAAKAKSGSVASCNVACRSVRVTTASCIVPSRSWRSAAVAARRARAAARSPSAGPIASAAYRSRLARMRTAW